MEGMDLHFQGLWGRLGATCPGEQVQIWKNTYVIDALRAPEQWGGDWSCPQGVQRHERGIGTVQLQRWRLRHWPETDRSTKWSLAHQGNSSGGCGCGCGVAPGKAGWTSKGSILTCSQANFASFQPAPELSWPQADSIPTCLKQIWVPSSSLSSPTPEEDIIQNLEVSVRLSYYIRHITIKMVSFKKRPIQFQKQTDKGNYRWK